MPETTRKLAAIVFIDDNIVSRIKNPKKRNDYL